MTKAEAVTAQVRVELLDHLRDLQKHGPRYINEYVESIVGKQTTKRPVPHLHPKLAELVRELALDAVVMGQRVPPPEPVHLQRRNNDRPLTLKEPS